MWLTIISTLLGIVSSSIPGVLSYLKQAQADHHELAMGQLKLNAAMAGYQIATNLPAIQADVADTDSARDADVEPVGASQWVINFKASVRPAITYIFFLIFTFAKIAGGWVIIAHSGLNSGNVTAVTNSILDEPFMAIMSVIVGFFFGSRSIDKLSNPPIKPSPKSKSGS